MGESLNREEIAQRLGVSRQRIYELSTRAADFPAPCWAKGEMGGVLYWDWDAVEQWWRVRDRTPGRPKRESAP